MKKIISIITLFISLNAHSLIVDNSTIHAVQDFHKKNPNAAFINKLSGMVRSFDMVLDMQCREIAYKYLKTTFLIYQTDEYYNCMQRGYQFILENELDVPHFELVKIIAGLEKYKQNSKLEAKIHSLVEKNLSSLKTKYSAYCPTNKAIRFGSYLGSGEQVEKLYCQNNVLALLVQTYSLKSDIDRIACGAGFSNCRGITVGTEEIEAMIQSPF